MKRKSKYTVGDLIKVLAILPKDAEVRIFSFWVDDGVISVAYDQYEKTVTLFGDYETDN